MSEISTGDLALMRDNDGFGGANSFMWIFALLILMFGMGGGAFGFGGRGPMPDFATQSGMTAGFNNSQTQAQLSQIALSSANNNYETARLVQTQTSELMQQNNTNLINAIQGFNQIGQQIQNQTNVLQGQLQSMSAQLNECCCSIKTQMLTDRLADRDRQLAERNAEISNYNQSQYLLGQMGKWVANAAAAAGA